MNTGQSSTVRPDQRADAEKTSSLVVIDSKSGLAHIIGEFILRRELLYFLIWRDIKIRYKQTVLGGLWAILVPLLQTFLFTVIFGRFAKMQPDGNYNYTVFVLAGLIPWTLFSQALTLGSQSLVNQQHLMTKVYFPRLYVPTAAVGGCLIDFLIGLLMYAVVLAYFHIAPTGAIAWLPALILLTVFSSLGIVYLMAALTVSYRDFKYVIPFAVQALMYASPVVYAMNIVPPKYQLILGLNPMTGIIDGYRSAILGKPWDIQLVAESVCVSLVFFVIGVAYFRSAEQRFADIA